MQCRVSGLLFASLTSQYNERVYKVVWAREGSLASLAEYMLVYMVCADMT